MRSWIGFALAGVAVWAGSAADVVLSTAELALYPGTTAAIVVTVDVLDDWYIQARVPGLRNLIPTTLALEPADGLSLGTVRYPEPGVKWLSFARRELPVYSGTVRFTVPVTVARDAQPGARLVRTRLTYQPCSDTHCLLPTEEGITLVVHVLAPEGVASPGIFPWILAAGAFALGTLVIARRRGMRG